MRMTLITISAAAIGLASSVAQAQEFGRTGQVVPSGQIGFSYSKVVPPADYDVDTQGLLSFSLAPDVLYFVTDHLALGGRLTFGYFRSGDNSGRLYSIAPVIALNCPLGDKVSFFPSASVSFGMSTSEGSNPSHDSKGKGMGVFAQAPLLYHVAPHFYLGAGPAASFDVLSRRDGQDSGRGLAVSLSTVIGGWF